MFSLIDVLLERPIILPHMHDCLLVYPQCSSKGNSRGYIPRSASSHNTKDGILQPDNPTSCGTISETLENFYFGYPTPLLFPLQ